MKRAQRALPASAALMVIVLVCGCSPSSPTSLPPPVISVSLTPAEQQTIQQNQTVGIVATVQGSSNNAVTWSLSGSGFLSNQSATSVTYNAPSSITAPQTATVTATPSADTTKAASLKIRVALAEVPLVMQPLLPPSAAPGGAGFTLTVNGVGFATSATVMFNGASLATTFVSGHRLTADVLAADIATAGTASITVANAPGGGLRSNPVYFPIAMREANLALVQAAGSPFPLGGVLGDMVSADFNGDGIPDLAVASAYATAPDINILLGKGDGTFSTANGSPIPMVASPFSVGAGDFNGDGKMDLLTTSQSANSAAVFLGNGDGTFTPAAGNPIPAGQSPSYLAVGDFNGDGKLDVAVSNPYTNSLTILLGNGDGTFTQAPNPPAAATYPATVTVGDFNGDGNLDLAVTVSHPSGVVVLLGNGDGTFTPAPGSPIPVGFFATGIVAADFNNDGKADLAVSDGIGNIVSILLGNGDGTFKAASGSPVPVGHGPFTEVLGDFNSDGELDLAVVNLNDNTVTILFGNGDGTFSATTSPVIVNQPGTMVTADFNGDGRLDFAIVDGFDNKVYVVLQQ